MAGNLKGGPSSAQPGNARTILAHRLWRKSNSEKGWVSAGGWCDGPAPESLVSELSDPALNDGSWRLEFAYADPGLTVWYGSMPESNGKKNWTAILYHKELETGLTLARSEYPDRVRYIADRARHLIGEIGKEPWILDYDGDKREPQVPSSGAGQPRPAGAGSVEALIEKVYALRACVKAGARPGATDVDHIQALQAEEALITGIRALARQVDDDRG